MSASSCQDSIVNSTQLRCSGAMGNIVRACISLARVHTGLSYLGSAEYRNLSDGRFATAKLLVPQCLDSCDLITIRKFFRKAWRYIDAYRYRIGPTLISAYILLISLSHVSRKGLDARQAAFANKKYKSHRRVGLPSDVIASLAAQSASMRT